MKNRIRPAVPSALLALLLAGACDERRAGGSSDDIDTSVGRVAVDASGSPVPAARIVLVASGDSSGTVQAATRTDASGRYPSLEVSDGYYGVLLRDSSGRIGRFVDSVRIVDRRLPSGFDTLRPLGSIRGVARLEEGESPISIQIGLLGTNIAANVGADGRFTVELVPGDIYTLMAATRLEGYEPLFRRIRVQEGQDLIIPDTLVVPFSGFPAPKGIQVTEDSSTGNVRLRWNRVDHPSLYGYQVDVLEGGVVVRDTFVLDTVFVDSLDRIWRSMPVLGPWPDRSIVYRISSRSRDGADDAAASAPLFVANAPSWTRQLSKPELGVTTGSGRDTLRWRSIGHPSVTGWRLERWTGDRIDCAIETSDTLIVDANCPERGWTAIDSLHYAPSGTPQVHLLERLESGSTWRLIARRRTDLSTIDSVALAAPDSESPAFVGNAVSAWPSDASLDAHGSWLVRKAISGGIIQSVSRNGLDWERVGIDCWDGNAAASDTMLSLLCVGTDKHSVVLWTRKGANDWSRDSIALDFSLTSVDWLAYDGTALVSRVIDHDYSSPGNHGIRLIRIDAGRLIVTDSVPSAMDGGSFRIERMPDGRWWFQFATSMPQTGFRIIDKPAIFMAGGGYVALDWGRTLGPWRNRTQALFLHNDQVALFDTTGNGRVVAFPSTPSSFAPRGDEAWGVMGDSLWKGTIR